MTNRKFISIQIFRVNHHKKEIPSFHSLHSSNFLSTHTENSHVNERFRHPQAPYVPRQHVDSAFWGSIRRENYTSEEWSLLKNLLIVDDFDSVAGDHQVDDFDLSGDARKDDELINEHRDANDHEHSNENVPSSLAVRDALYDRMPTVVVSVSYYHPILSQLSDGDFWCGAPPSEEVYENPYNAARYSWDIRIDAWNSFQSIIEKMDPEELEALPKKRKDDIDRQISEFDNSYKGPKRKRYSDDSDPYAFGG